MSINTVTSRKVSPTTLAAALAGLLMVTGCTKQAEEDITVTDTQTESATTTDKTRVSAAEQANIDRLVISYADMAHAAYKDSLETAKMLQTAVNTYVNMPTQANLDAAKAAYKAARQPYSQTEIFRFDQGFVTANERRTVGSIDS